MQTAAAPQNWRKIGVKLAHSSGQTLCRACAHMWPRAHVPPIMTRSCGRDTSCHRNSCVMMRSCSVICYSALGGARRNKALRRWSRWRVRASSGKVRILHPPQWLFVNVTVTAMHCAAPTRTEDAGLLVGISIPYCGVWPATKNCKCFVGSQPLPTAVVPRICWKPALLS